MERRSFINRVLGLSIVAIIPLPKFTKKKRICYNLKVCNKFGCNCSQEPRKRQAGEHYLIQPVEIEQEMGALCQTV